ncbi:hypothetical protein AN958_12410 [Leucoagaricus sp. SymC.cos]|nr:hypothetical protein AN958_12410 [Leucoagaricus sp. SymC.cos]
MTSLPREVPQRLQHLAHPVSAYDICLRLEESLELAVDNDDVGNNLVYIRILGYLIHYVPTDLGLRKIVEEISSCVDDSAILAVGQLYYDHYIRAFRANRAHIPTPPNHPSRPSFDRIQDMIDATLQEAPQSHAQAKKYALVRDGYRCVVTGKYDTHSVKMIQELKEMVDLDPSARGESTQCAHIFSKSTNSSIEPDSAKREYATTIPPFGNVMTLALVRDGYRCVVTGKYDTHSVKMIQELKEMVDLDPSARGESTQCAHIFSKSTNSSIEPDSAKVCPLSLLSLNSRCRLPTPPFGNVMTLVPGFHMDFDQLYIWFVATKEMNRYKLEASDPFFLRSYPEFVTFTTPDSKKLPVPSPTYLAIHAACAKVAHLSGAAACIDKFYQDMEDRKTLDPDGASANMLEHASTSLIWI